MKQHIFTFVVLSSIVLFLSCGNDLSEIIVGKWAVNSIEIRNIDTIYDIFVAEHKTDLEFAEFEDSIKQKLTIYCMDFYEDYSFRFCSSDSKGTWKIEDDAIIIDDKDTYKIVVQKIATDDYLIAHLCFRRFQVNIDSQIFLERLK